MEYVRIVLKPQATLRDVLTTGTRVTQWIPHNFTPLERDEPYTKTWRSVDGKSLIAYWQDPLREVRCYHLIGANLDPHVAIIRGRIATYNQGEIEALIASARTPTEKIVAVYHAAASSPPKRDEAIFDFLTRSATDPEPCVRKATVDAALVALWPELRESLERVAASDPNSDLRAFATETLETLRDRVWTAPPTFDFAPLPPNRKRINPLTGVGDAWFEAAHGRRPEPRVPTAAVPVPAPSRKPQFHLPVWLVALMQEENWPDVRWHEPDQILATASLFTEFTKPARMIISPTHLAREQSLWESMVPVAEGLEFTDRVGRTERARLFVNRDDPQELLLALAPDHPPSLWVPTGRTRREVDVVAAAYFFPGIPPESSLPFQGRLFLATQTSLRGSFADIERGVNSSPFTDLLPWGSGQSTDPYPERVVLGQVPARELNVWLAQNPGVLPRTSIRTRYSRSIIRLLDWRGVYFADLYFRPTPPLVWAKTRNIQFGVDFPEGTPIDTVGALSGLACIGSARIRSQAEKTTDEAQRSAIQEIIGFIERAPRPM